MPDQRKPNLSIFSEMENLQNDLLERIDHLDRRVKQVLDDWTKHNTEEKKAS